MTPTTLQTLAPAAPAPTDPARRAAPGDEPATFAAVLDGSVQALSGEGEPAESEAPELTTIEARQEDGTQAGLVQADPQVTVLASDQPRLDALALMLATASAPPGQAAPGAAAAGTAGAGTTPAVSDPLAAAAQARAVFDGTAASMLRRIPAQAAGAHPDDGDPAPAAASGSTEADATADLARAAVAASPGAQRREGHAAAAQSRQVSNVAAADHVDGTDTAGNPRPTAAAAASATTPSIVAGMRDPADAAPAAIGKAGPLAASPATPGAARRLSADPEAGPAATSATRALQPGPIAAQDAAPAPAQAPAATDLAGPGAAIAAASAPASPGAVAHLAPPVGSPDWAPALAQQLVRLPGGGAVELNLNPVELGPLQVKLSMVEGQAQVQFVAEHAAVRQALEAALPQLRASFAENGISLGQANVGAGAGEPRTGQDGGERPATGSEREARARADEPAAAAGPHREGSGAARIGAVDTFA